MPVRLTLASGPTPADRREVVVVPASSESDFRYLDWLARTWRPSKRPRAGRSATSTCRHLHRRGGDVPQYWYGQTQKEG